MPTASGSGANVQPPAQGLADFPDPAETSFAAFLEDSVARAFGDLHPGGRQPGFLFTRDGAEGGAGARGGSSDEELGGPAHFEYDLDRDEFSGMYS